MESIEQQIKDSMVRYLNRVMPYTKVVEVVSWKEDLLSEGYCETCYYEFIGVEIEYIDSDGKQHVYTYYDRFTDLIKELIHEV